MKSALKKEFLYLWDLVRFREPLKAKARGWDWQHFIIVLVVYLSLDITASIVFGYGLYSLFPSYFESSIMETEGLFFLMVILLPIIEELLFRLPMTYHSKRLKCWLFLVGLFLFELHWAVSLATLIFATFMTVKDLDKGKYVQVKAWHRRNSKTIFWILTFAFAFVHVTNYNLNELPVYAYPIVVATQLIGGILLGIVRLRFGLRYAILNHIAFNLVIYLASVA